MNDPFFDEDDGEFDDLYGNPPPSASSPPVRQKPRNNEVLEARSTTPGSRSFAWSPVASSSVVSRSHTRDRIGSSTGNITDLTASGKQEKKRKKRGKPRHKGSRELFDVQWESDVKVVKCGLCKSDFSLVRRKHHCRHCGRIMCSDCSSFLYFELSGRKHRVCSTCNNLLMAEQDAYERETITADRASSARSAKPNDDEKTRKKVGHKSTANETAIFDGAGDDWFTDVPDQQTCSRDSIEVYSEDSGSKGPGWRDRVKDTYTVTEHTSVLAPMAGSSLTAGITGKGYILDEFRYDVSGPSCKHDDDISVEMPRPKQQITPLTYTDRSVKPSGLSGKGYFSKQFQYDDVGGPGLGHDDDRSVAMPRPKQQLTTTPYSNKSARHNQKQSESNFTDDSTPHEQDFQARLTFTDIFRATKRRETTAKKKERKAKASNRRSLGNQNMTLDELNASCSSQDEACTLAPTVPNLSTAQPTFYDQDADELVIDESPGYFEATMEEREAQQKKEEKQHEQLARDMAWVNSSSLPTTVQPRRISSDHDSYSIVNLSSHTSNSPIGYQQGDVNDSGASGKPKSGFTGTLKRFFGMGPKKATTLQKPVKTPPRPAKTPRAAVVASPEKDIAENHTSPALDANHHDGTSTTGSVTGGLLRHTLVDYNGVNREEPIPQANFRHTMTAHVDLNSRVEVSLPSQIGEVKQHSHKQESERKRRGTFDELFMSPKDNLAINDRFSTGNGRGWAARVEENTNRGQASFGIVGVARFDQRRIVDKAEEFVLGNGPLSVPLSQPADDSTEAWRKSAASSLLNDRKAATQSDESGFSWSNIRSASGLGTATYAVPTSLQSRAVYSDAIGVSTQYETPATLGSIMDDLKHGSASTKSQGKESIDDFFAEFEETNDYVYDSTTGGYVTARVPARAVATRDVKRLESTELQVPEKVTPRINDHGYNDPSPIAGTAVATNDDDGEEVEDEVAEIIVDKISSLESELAALKRLIRTRKGSGGNQSSKPRVSRSIAKPSVRKESIFDNDSSDEDNGKNTPYASSVRPVVERGSKRRPGSKKKVAKTRRDSFADLFEDSPNEHEVFGGATSYEALFQTEAKLTEISKEDVSDDDADRIQPPQSRAAISRRSSRKTSDFVLSNDDSDSEPELTSLKKRRGKQSSRRKTREDVDDTSPNMNEGHLVTSPLRLGAKRGSTIKQVEEDDPIDALFDTSNDRDVTKLYGVDDGHDGKDKHFVLESTRASVSNGKSVLLSLESSLDVEASGSPAAVTANMEYVAPLSEANASYSYSLDSQGLDEADEEEDFTINWSKMRKTKLRRQKTPASSNAAVESFTIDSTTEGVLLEPSLFSKDSDVNVNDIPAKHAVPTAKLADASSSWMSVGALEDETANLNLIGGDLESQPVDESKHMMESATEAAVASEKTQDDEADVFPVSASMIPAPVDDTVPNSKAKKAVLTGDAGGSVEHLSLANVGLVEESSDTNAKVVREDEAAFDIFDKSGDVELLSISSPMSLKSPDQKEVGNDSENDDRESLSDEVFSFAIQAPKKRSSVDVPTNISSIQSVSEHSELPPPSPTSSTDDGVELRKYATISVPPSSHTPSIDSSLDDLEDAMVDDDLVLGKVEPQAFDTDWQQMQAEEKERKKRLQVKQRQAQRDKLLRKQGASTKPLSGSAATHGSSKNKSKSGKKKKRDKEKDAASSSSSHHKKSGSSRKYRRDATDSASLTPSEPPRSLTEL